MEDKRIEPITEYDTPAYKPRKKRFGDRKEGRRLRSLPAMNLFMPYIMKPRNDSMNQFEDVIDITAIEKYLAVKKKEGYTGAAVAGSGAKRYHRAGEREGLDGRETLQCIFWKHRRPLRDHHGAQAGAALPG